MKSPFSVNENRLVNKSHCFPASTFSRPKQVKLQRNKNQDRTRKIICNEWNNQKKNCIFCNFLYFFSWDFRLLPFGHTFCHCKVERKTSRRKKFQWFGMYRTLCVCVVFVQRMIMILIRLRTANISESNQKAIYHFARK